MTLALIHSAPASAQVDIQQRVVDITPELAAKLLEGNLVNRELSERRVSQYVTDMASGAWPYTGDPIRITEDGQLLDGQHRLTAVVRSGVTLPMMVMTGVPADHQRYMDTGRLRTLGDEVHMMGLPHSTIVAATARMVLSITDWPDVGQEADWNRVVRIGAYAARNVSITKPQGAAFVANHKDLVHSAEIGTRATAGCSAPPTVLSFLHYAASAINRTQADDFLGKLHTGAGLEMGDPIRAAREQINRARRESEQKSIGANAMYLLLVAWNHHRTGNRVERLMSPKGGMTGQTTVIMK